jgi:teichuronic acid biosynthesis glycosyltransferase TuaG
MGSESPLVSVVTPLYNAERYIEETLRSVMEQSLDDWECLVIDDCSTDGGPSIVRSLVEEDPRIRLLSLETNSGAGASRNAGIEASRGRFIAFLDSDDAWEPEKLEKQTAFMTETASPFSFTDYRKIAEDGSDLGRTVRCRKRLTYSRQLLTNYVGCSTAMYDTKFYGKRYFPLIRKRQDFALWLDLLSDGAAGRGLSEPLTRYRVRSSGLSGNKLELVRHNWLLYRDVLGFGRIKSAYYVLWNIAIKILGRR